jgi:hypothetical protein
MSEQSNWNRQAIVDYGIARQEMEKQLKMLRPDAVAHAPAPPAPELRAVLDNPQMAAAFWGPAAPMQGAVPATSQAEQRPSDAEAAIQIGLALHLLQAIHTQDKPGHEHLPGETRKPRRGDEDEGIEPLTT